MDLYLVRHGLSTWNLAGRWQGTCDPELADLGWQQAEATASYFIARAIWDEEHFTALYSSSLRRAWQTAHCIGTGLGLAPQPVEGLREMACGVVEGLTGAEQQLQYPHLLRAWQDPTNLDFGWPGGETRRDFAARCRRTLTTLCARHGPDDRLIVVTHGGVIQAYLAGTTVSDATGSAPYEADNCSITHVHVDLAPAPDDERPAEPGDPMPRTVGCLQLFNHRAHLPVIATLAAGIR